VDDLSPYRDLFVSEAQDYLQLMNDSILELEREVAAGPVARDNAALEQLFRAAHTLKGMAATMGYGDMARVAHALEDLLDAVRRERLALAGEHITLCFAATDVMGAALAAITNEQPAPAAVDELMRAVAASVPRETGEAPAARRRPAPGLPATGFDWIVEVTVATDCALRGLRAHMVLDRLKRVGAIVATDPPQEDLEAERFDFQFRVALQSAEPPEPIAQLARGVAEIAGVEVRPPDAVAAHGEPEVAREAPAGVRPLLDGTAPLPASTSVRIGVRQLDRLLNLVGELVITRGQLARLGGEIEHPRLAAAIEAHQRIVDELQDAVLTARLVPVAQVFDRFPRMVRDLLVSEGKEADFVLAGRELEIDRTILERLADVLVHLLRNAVDHGLELPDERDRQGKPRRGVVRLEARREREMIVIEVADDGRGMDPARIGAAAVEQGLVTPAALAQLSDAEKLELVCHPGFSTAERVTNISGRGVGLAAVKRQVEELRGVLEIGSEAGAGARFRLRLPLTLAIVRALLVGAHGETYAVPFDYIERVREVYESGCFLEDDEHAAPGSVLVTPEDARLPAVWLGRWVAPPLTPPREAGGEGGGAPPYALIVRRGDQLAALLVDALIGKEEIVVKTLPPMLRDIPGLAGATIIGDGQVVLILDIPQLMARAA
jgi:two-component system chemotaxis sensor kinase CheA